MDILLPLICFIAAIVLLFMPARSAFKRKHKNRKAILYLNLLAGWSLVGWIAAMVWAQTESLEPSEYELTKREKSNLRDTMIVGTFIYIIFWGVLFNMMKAPIYY